jgi:hypothetical protein
MSFKLRTSKSTTWVLLILVTGAILGTPSLLYPFGRDQGEYATIAWLFLLGKDIYAEVINIKPPGTHLVHALSQVLFGHSMQAIRILDLLMQLSVAIALFFLPRACASPHSITTGVLAALTYLYTYFCFDFWSTAQTEGFQNFFVTFGVLAWVCGKKNSTTIAFFLAGALFACATFFKYPIGILFIFCVVDPLLAWARGQQKLSQTAALAFGFLVICFLVFVNLYLTDALLPAYEAAKYYYSVYYSPQTSGFPIPSALAPAFFSIGPICLGLSFICLLALPSAYRSMQSILLPWLLAVVLQCILQGKFYDYHFIALLPPISLGASVIIFGLCFPLQRLLLAGCAGVNLSFVLLLATFQHIGLWHIYEQVGQTVQGKLSLENFQVSVAFGCYNCKADHSFKANLEVAREIIRKTESAQAVLIVGFEPAIYFLSQRVPATSLLYSFPLYPSFNNWGLRERLMREITTYPPAMIVVARHDAIPWVTGSNMDSRQLVDDFQEFRNYLIAHYQKYSELEDFLLYGRVGDFPFSGLQGWNSHEPRSHSD